MNKTTESLLARIEKLEATLKLTEEALRMISTFQEEDNQCDNGYGAAYVANEALAAIREALVEPVKQEPVVYRVWHRMGGISYQSTKPSETEYVEWDALYAAPVQQVELTVSDLDAIIEKHYDDEMDLKAMILDGIAAYKDKNK